MKYGSVFLRLIFIYAVFAVFGMNNLCAQSNKKKQLQNQKANIEKEISNTSKLIKETQKNSRKTTQQIKLIESQVRNYESLISKTGAEMALLEREIERKKLTVAKLKRELNALKSQYARMVYFAYLTRKPANRLVYLFSSRSVMMAWRRMNYFREYSAIRKNQVKRISQTSSDIELSLSELEGMRNEKLSLKSDQEKQKNQLASQKKEKDKVVKDLKKQESKLRANLKKKQREATEIQRKIQKMIEAEIEASKKKANTVKANNKTSNSKPNAYQMTPEEARISNTFAGNKGKIPWPVAQGAITDRFGEHPHPVLHDIKVKNNGIDISAPKGSSARAVYEGTVSAVITAPNGTTMIMIRHGEYLSVYSNIKTAAVKKGSSISSKQNLGPIAVDEEGATVLHFEIWKEKVPQNPEYWIAK